MTTTQRIAGALREAMLSIDSIYVGIERGEVKTVKFSCEVDEDNASNFIIATSDGCHFKVIVVRDE